MKAIIHSIVAAGFAAILLGAAASPAAAAADKQIARGKYLVVLGSCTDCHTPGHFLGKEEAERHLAGSDVGFFLPGLGTFLGPNLTNDKETGLGNWTVKQVVAALQTGVRPDGRILAPVMPWQAFAHMTKSDATAVAVYLKSLPPISHKVAGPFGPDEKVTSFVMTVVPADVFNAMPKPGGPPPAPAK
jgi:mono/diheme cytochrome c family protein